MYKCSEDEMTHVLSPRCIGLYVHMGIPLSPALCLFNCTGCMVHGFIVTLLPA